MLTTSNLSDSILPLYKSRRKTPKPAPRTGDGILYSLVALEPWRNSEVT